MKMTGIGETMGRRRMRRGRREIGEMVLSTAKSTGEWFGSSGGLRHVSESIIKME